MLLIVTIAFFVALAADFLTTRMALLRGLDEMNPMLKGNPLLKMGIASTAFIIFAEIMRWKGQPQWTACFYLMGAIAHGGAAAWNVYVLSK